MLLLRPFIVFPAVCSLLCSSIVLWPVVAATCGYRPGADGNDWVFELLSPTYYQNLVIASREKCQVT